MVIDRSEIERFINLFDGDIVAAAKSLQQYARDTQAISAPPRPKRAASGETVVAVTDLKKSYKLGKQTVEALRGVSLEINKNEFIALTGPSGSGKSTLLQMIGGLDKPTSGTVTVNDTDVSRMSDRALSEFRNRTIGFVFQFFYLQPFLRLRQNLEVAGMPSRTPRIDRSKRVQELAGIVGLDERLEHFPRELSGGQMQRAAIARALLNKPAILLADEPTGNLDSENGRMIIDLFERIRDEIGTTVVVVTHDTEVARRADRVVELKDGRIV